MQVAPTTRFSALDSLRGLAAFIVVLHHLDLSVPETFRNNFAHSLLEMGGRFAVMLFFVLSGFVLALPYFAGTSSTYKPYLVKRFCRLYPPYAFAVLVAALLCFLLGGTSLPLGSDWLNQSWSSPVSWGVVASHLLAIGIHQDSIRLDNPIWSLIIEMRMSIIFPLLVLYVRRFGWLGIAAALAVAFFCTKARISLGEPSTQIAESVTGAFLLTGRYVVLFLLGIILAERRDRIERMCTGLPRNLHGAIFIGMAIIWAVLAYMNMRNINFRQGYVDMFYALFTMYLIVICFVFPKVSHSLSGRICLWLGDISYSLYLIHVPVLLAVFYLLNGHVSLNAITVIALPAMLIAGHIMHYLIERPSMMLGKKFAKRAPS